MSKNTSAPLDIWVQRAVMSTDLRCEDALAKDILRLEPLQTLLTKLSEKFRSKRYHSNISNVFQYYQMQLASAEDMKNNWMVTCHVQHRVWVIMLTWLASLGRQMYQDRLYCQISPAMRREYSVEHVQSYNAIAEEVHAVCLHRTQLFQQYKQRQQQAIADVSLP